MSESKKSEEKADDKLDNKDAKDVLIELSFNVALFISTGALIFHELGIMSCVNNKA